MGPALQNQIQAILGGGFHLINNGFAILSPEDSSIPHLQGAPSRCCQHSLTPPTPLGLAFLPKCTPQPPLPLSLIRAFLHDKASVGAPSTREVSLSAPLCHCLQMKPPPYLLRTDTALDNTVCAPGPYLPRPEGPPPSTSTAPVVPPITSGALRPFVTSHPS